MKKTQKDIDEQFMREALKQAQLAFEAGEVPVGAVLVYNDKIIAKSQNQVELLQDVTAHAELVLVSSAGEYFQTKYLPMCTLYVTLEPCAMCASAIGWAQVSRLVFGAEDPQKGYRRTAPTVLHPKCKVTYAILEEDSQKLLSAFFSNLRSTN